MSKTRGAVVVLAAAAAVALLCVPTVSAVGVVAAPDSCTNRCGLVRLGQTYCHCTVEDCQAVR